MNISLFNIPEEELERTLDTLENDPVGDELVVSSEEQRRLCVLLRHSNCPNVADILESFSPSEVEDFLVNEVWG